MSDETITTPTRMGDTTTVVEVPALDAPVYQDFDLGEFAEEYRGKTVQLLRNPTGEFRKGFWAAQGELLRAYFAAIIGVPCADSCLDAVFDTMPLDAMKWLFLGMFDPDANEEAGEKRFILPHVYAVWDDWIAARVKARAARMKTFKTQTPPESQ